MTAPGVTTVPAAEAMLNADGEAVLFVPSLGGRPVGWRDAGGGVVDVVMGDGTRRPFGCPPEALGSARRRGRFLLVETDGGAPSSEGWLALDGTP